MRDAQRASNDAAYCAKFLPDFGLARKNITMTPVVTIQLAYVERLG